MRPGIIRKGTVATVARPCPDYDRRVSTRRTALTAIVTVAGLTGAGCTHTVHVGAARTLQVALSEYRINPNSIRVTPGFLTLVVRNYGRLTHNLVVARDGRVQGATGSIPPGREATLIVDLARGRYSLASTILSDADLGARGTLTVR